MLKSVSKLFVEVVKSFKYFKILHENILAVLENTQYYFGMINEFLSFVKLHYKYKID